MDDNGKRELLAKLGAVADDFGPLAEAYRHAEARKLGTYDGIETEDWLDLADAVDALFD